MPNNALFPQGPRGRSAQVRRANVLFDATIRDFSGGWNVVDSDLNLDTRYAKILENMQRGIGGANVVRPGTVLFADTSEYLDEIINCEYYNDFIVCVGSNGKVVKVDINGVVTLIWDDEFAGNLPGNPAGWAPTFFASFAIFNGELIICNGVNKPLIVNIAMTCTYLQDLADKSNANVPIARFVATHGRYLLMAGDLSIGNEDTLYISNTDTSGTWVGASDPNDAVNVSLGSRVTSGSHVIKGIGKFRDTVMIFFENVILPGTLGTFTDSVHVPDFTDAFENIGAVSHRVIQTIGEDIIFGDVTGVASIKRALFTGNVSSERASHLIAPDYLKSLSDITSKVAQEDRIWSIWDSQSYNYMVFVPNSSSIDSTIETRCFVHKRNKKLKLDSWQDWRNWNFRSGCRSALKRIFLTEGTQIFRLGDEFDEQVFKDYEGDQEMWDDNQPWTDYTGWNPVADANDSGIPIRFIWELPWSDNDQRFLTKASRYINLDTVGNNRFNISMFTDNNYNSRTDLGEDWQEDNLKWDDGLGWDVDVLDPALTLEFEGGDALGFGLDGFGDEFGGGRPTRLEQLFAFTARYKIQKLRMYGDATNELQFVSITLAYQQGSPRRQIMASAVDSALPPDNVKSSKADFRAQFLVIKNEITALQRETSLAWKIADGTQSV